jgi:NAD(P)-dependent dehydrogenase (short-subunit alcohol dehydrogenase family)
MRELTNRVAVITGAGSGIGAAVARACHAAGMTVAVVDVNADRARAVVDELRGGPAATAFSVDVSDAAQVDDLAAQVLDRFGACHLLHNNAGVCPMGRAWEHSAEEWHHVVGINLLGVVHGVNAFVPRMLTQEESSHIVNTASAAALRPVPVSALYNATKYGVLGFSESLRQNLAPHGIGVSVLCPGGVATRIAESIRGTVGPPRSDDQINALLGEFGCLDVAHVTPITPEQVASLVLEGIRNDDAYIVTHPGSRAEVLARSQAIGNAYREQHARHPELP